MSTKVKLTPTRRAWLAYLVKIGGTAFWDRMPGRVDPTGKNRRMGGATHGTWAPMVEAGWLTRQYGPMGTSFTITELGRKVYDESLAPKTP
jgi:hypothetical protein